MRQRRDPPPGRTLVGRKPGIRLPSRPYTCAVQTIVAGKRQQETAGGLAVPPGSSSLLDVRLERRRHPEVGHETDRRMIDAHAEGVRRAHHPMYPTREIILEA